MCLPSPPPGVAGVGCGYGFYPWTSDVRPTLVVCLSAFDSLPGLSMGNQLQWLKKREREAFNLESRRYRAPLPSQVSLWVKLYIPLILRFPKHKTGRASMQGVQGWPALVKPWDRAGPQYWRIGFISWDFFFFPLVVFGSWSRFMGGGSLEEEMPGFGFSHHEPFSRLISMDFRVSGHCCVSPEGTDSPYAIRPPAHVSSHSTRLVPTSWGLSKDYCSVGEPEWVHFKMLLHWPEAGRARPDEGEGLSL